ncbi:MAG TPA: hypothetical protein VG538_14745 [Vicinamibacterales bacterium]|jgi:hypothetical protein|nr:hypothetical protein [Vicinamibacterales bacterium]
MKTTNYARKESDQLKDIVSMLEGRVFHVTRHSSYAHIVACGEVRTNRDGALASGFGYRNSFFRRHDCVSLFDYRKEPTLEILACREQCWPFMFWEVGGEEVVILIFKREIEPHLILWTYWKGKKRPDERIVPDVEVGHRGPIRIAMVEEVIVLACVEDPTSPAALVRQALKGPDAKLVI